jgi:hypothetical protein
MKTELPFDILPQPDEASCGPTCLHGVYRYYHDRISLGQVISEVPSLENGGTLAVLLGSHAVKRGYRAILYTYNLRVFDPTWFEFPTEELKLKLKSQLKFRQTPMLQMAIRAYMEFMELGGEIRFDDLTAALIGKHLERSAPILTGLSATYLYRCARELDNEYDDIRGKPVGHFVVLCGYDSEKGQVRVADPLLPNPVSETHGYDVQIDRVIASIFLGSLTYDANLLIIMSGENKAPGVSSK